MSIEYVFFDERFRDVFMQYVSSKGVASKARQDEMDGFVVALPDDLDDAVAEAIDAEYELLMEKQDAQAESEEGWVSSDAMGVEILLADGRPCVVRIPAVFIRRVTEHFTPEEIHSLVTAIAQCVENPVAGPICKMI